MNMENKVLDQIELNPNSISLAGEFAVLSQLSLRGYDANMTLGNTKHVDILVSDPKSGGMFKLEVKTHYGNNASRSSLFGYTLDWVMSEKHENISAPDLFYCFVKIQKDTRVFRFFIVPSGVVANYVRKQHQYWVDQRKNVVASTTLRRFRIGLDNSGYKIETPLAVEYEDKWDFKFAG